MFICRPANKHMDWQVVKIWLKRRKSFPTKPNLFKNEKLYKDKIYLNSIINSLGKIALIIEKKFNVKFSPLRIEYVKNLQFFQNYVLYFFSWYATPLTWIFNYCQTLDCYGSHICFEKSTMTWIHKMYENAKPYNVMTMVRVFIKNEQPSHFLFYIRNKW